MLLQALQAPALGSGGDGSDSLRLPDCNEPAANSCTSPALLIYGELHRQGCLCERRLPPAQPALAAARRA